MISKITKAEYPELWDYITDEYDGFDDMEHRRGSTFYITPRYTLTDDIEGLPPELYGLWEADTCTWSDDWGLDDTPDTLYRIEETIVERVVKEKIYKRVV